MWSGRVVVGGVIFWSNCQTDDGYFTLIELHAVQEDWRVVWWGVTWCWHSWGRRWDEMRWNDEVLHPRHRDIREGSTSMVWWLTSPVLNCGRENSASQVMVSAFESGHTGVTNNKWKTIKWVVWCLKSCKIQNEYILTAKQIWVMRQKNPWHFPVI
jgi:hypothetical protein